MDLFDQQKPIQLFVTTTFEVTDVTSFFSNPSVIRVSEIMLKHGVSPQVSDNQFSFYLHESWTTQGQITFMAIKDFMSAVMLHIMQTTSLAAISVSDSSTVQRNLAGHIVQRGVLREMNNLVPYTDNPDWSAITATLESLHKEAICQQN
mgnify:CR=1 FL=1